MVNYDEREAARALAEAGMLHRGGPDRLKQKVRLPTYADTQWVYVMTTGQGPDYGEGVEHGS